MGKIRVSKKTWNAVTRSNPWATPWAKPDEPVAKRTYRQRQEYRPRMQRSNNVDEEAVNGLMMLAGIVAVVLFVLYAISR
jgi:hypothetical protein